MRRVQGGARKPKESVNFIVELTRREVRRRHRAGERESSAAFRGHRPT